MEEKQVKKPEMVDLAKITDINSLKVLAYDASEAIQIHNKELQMINVRIGQLKGNAGI